MEWEFDDIDFEKVEEEEEEQDEGLVEVDVNEIDNTLNVANILQPRFDYKMESLKSQVISAKPAKAANYNYRSRDAFNIEDYN